MNSKRNGRSLPERIWWVPSGASPKESPYTDLIPDIFGKVSALIDGMEGRMDGGDEGIFAYDAEDER